MIRVRIDPNVRVRGQLTYAGFEDVEGNTIPNVGESVLAVEPESGIAAPAIVTERVDEPKLLYLGVAWREFREFSGESLTHR